MKRMRKLLTIIMVLGLLVSIVGFAAPASAENAQEKNLSTERILVKFKPGTPWNETAQVHSQVGGKVDSVISGIGVHVVTVPRGQGASKSAAYRMQKEVGYVERDSLVQVVDIPDDPHFNTQWGMTKVQAPQAWDIVQGSLDIVIAILDTGVDSDHPDLEGKIISEINFGDSDTSDDRFGHGTHVAGIAAATTDNGIGVAGLGHDCSLMNVKVLDDSGSGYYSWIIQGITWAADNGADVINLSLGGYIMSSMLEDAVNYAWDKGVVVTAAAGNSGSTAAFYPAYYTNCIAIGATNSNDVLASFSNHGDWVDVAAPGESIYSTLPIDGAIPLEYFYKSGTSMASPHVAGLAGLVLSMTTDSNGDGRVNDEARSIIESSCDDIGIDVTYGRINAYQAVQGFPSQPTGQIAGTVTDAASGDAIAGAMVSDGTRTAMTDSGGYYSITEVPESSYTVTASAEGYLGASGDAVVTAGETTVADFVLTHINRAPTLDTIGDKVVAEGQLLQFVVSASDADGDTLTYSAGDLPAGASFNPSTQTFVWIPGYDQAGIYAGVGFEVSDGVLSDAEEITITVTDVVLTGQIAGTVTDAASGDAIAGATVSDGTRTATTDSGGYYSITEVPEGSYTVTALANGYESASSSIVINPYIASTSTVDFSLEKEVSPQNTMWVESITFTPSGKHLMVTVMVVNPDPVKKAQVTLELVRDGTQVSRYSGSTNKAGEVTFRLRHVANGEYLARIIQLTHQQYVWDDVMGASSAPAMWHGS